MKERPILFSGAMVRALLDGSKTQTRRILKEWSPKVGTSAVPADVAYLRDFTCYRSTCPYGQPGDRLWVRETWAQPAALDPGPTVYRADYPACVPPGFTNLPAVDEIMWKPSIHMFRAHSRILLEIVSVRVERLNDCSEADAIAEGIPEDGSPCTRCNSSGWVMDGGDPVQCSAKGCGDGAVDEYRALWESINGAGSWGANPWVWVIEFKRVTP